MNIQAQLDQWKTAAQANLQALAQGVRTGAELAYKGAPGLLYGTLAASSLLPVIGAAYGGDYAPLMALFNLVGGVGGNLLANRMNCEQSEIASTSTVGCFPGGDSPYGVAELSGNMWEWTRSLWGDDLYNAQYTYPYQATDGRENLAAPITTFRVMRGGSYYNEGTLGRCAVRDGGTPVNWDGYLGLRVVASPFTSGL